MLLEPPLFPEVLANLRYAVLEHHATHRHWDFRLEKNDTVKDFVFDTLPIQTLGFEQIITQLKDHPHFSLSAEEINGVFPGTMNVKTWDEGRYDTIEWSENIIVVDIQGQKLCGRFRLVRKYPQTAPTKWWFSKIN